MEADGKKIENAGLCTDLNSAVVPTKLVWKWMNEWICSEYFIYPRIVE